MDSERAISPAVITPIEPATRRSGGSSARVEVIPQQAAVEGSRTEGLSASRKEETWGRLK